METGKTIPDIIVVTGGLEAMSVAQLAVTIHEKVHLEQVIIPEELNKISPFEKPPIYITNPYKDSYVFTPPLTRQERRAKERKQNKKK